MARLRPRVLGGVHVLLFVAFALFVIGVDVNGTDGNAAVGDE